ncbi:MAG: hypothetical protein ACF8GE_06185 [Phycisphaerales bacterium JB043]
MLCLAHFVGLAMLKHSLEREAEMLWVSNVSLVFVGVALVLSLPLLSKIALTLIGVPHTLWVADAAFGVLLGFHPLGMVAYLSHVDYLQILATSHHLYLLPMLLLIHHRFRSLDRVSLLSALACYMYLVLVCRVATDPQLNVNWVFVPFPSFTQEWIRGLDALQPALMLSALVGVVALIAMIPVTLVSQLAQRRNQAQ